MKKNLMRVLALTAAAVMAVTALSGCGTKKNDGNTSATTGGEQLVMGTNAAFPPFEYVTSEGVNGQYAGIDVEIAEKIAKSMGKSLKIEDMEFEGLVASVQTGKIDMAVAGMTANEERKEKVDFSDTYYVAAQNIVVAKDNTSITCAEDLKNGKKVGVVLGYTGDSIVTDTLKLDEKNIVRTSRGIDAVQDVKNGKLDAVVIDSVTGKALAEKNDLKVVEDSEVFETEEYAIAVQKGNTELLNKINKVLAEMKESGEIDALTRKYNEEVEIPAAE